MYILSCAANLENGVDNIIQIQDAGLDRQYYDAGYQRHERIYKIKLNYKEFIVICPEYRNKDKSLEPIAVVPEFLVPGRPYPVYVYLYAISIYANSPKKGQRWASEETRKKFGLATFAHTTLGRALKALVRAISMEPMAPGGADAEAADPRKSPAFPSAQSTVPLRKLAAKFLAWLPTSAVRQKIAAASYEMAREWFSEYCCFLL